MTNAIVVGPLLGFEDGDLYTVCVLLDAAVHPRLTVEGLDESPVLTQLATVGAHRFWRAEFRVMTEATGRRVDYRLTGAAGPLSDRHGRVSWTFYVPGTEERPLIAYASCNGFSSAGLVRDTDRPYRLWEEMKVRHKANPFSLLLMGGDQLYADEIWESRRCPRLREWGEKSLKAQIDQPVTPELNTEIRDFYDWLYTDRWGNEHLSLMLASIPSIMMWDDHDIFDGWGSYPKKRQECRVYGGIFEHAARVFDLFQLRGPSGSRLAANAKHRTLGLRFRDYLILVLDNRSERSLSEVMSRPHWELVKSWLERPIPVGVKDILILAAVPVVFRSYSFVEAIFDVTPWQDRLDDDVHDHWSSPSHAAEMERLAMFLFDLLERRSAGALRITLLSGDVHVGALGQLRHVATGRTILQLTSSGIVHPAPSALQWAGVVATTSDKPRRLAGGSVVAEMLTMSGVPRYLRTRNFLTLQVGTDGFVWANWVCENEKWAPYVAVRSDA